MKKKLVRNGIKKNSIAKNINNIIFHKFETISWKIMSFFHKTRLIISSLKIIGKLFFQSPDFFYILIMDEKVLVLCEK